MLAEKATDLVEAWAFTYKLGQRGPFGVPVGELPMTLLYWGTQEGDTAEARVDHAGPR